MPRPMTLQRPLAFLLLAGVLSTTACGATGASSAGRAATTTAPTPQPSEPLGGPPRVSASADGGATPSASRRAGGATHAPSAPPTQTPNEASATRTSGATWQNAMASGFARLAPRLNAQRVGVRVLVLGRTDPLSLGSWDSGPAWSTIKIPLSLAALAHTSTASTHALVHRAIEESDNAAADGLWGSLGAGTRAAAAVNRQLAAEGDAGTRTQSRQVHPPFSPYGQTDWSLAGQVAFASGLACDRSAPATMVKADMATVTNSQRWGLGQIPGARFKGGWGPDTAGHYLVRQVGLLTRGMQVVVVAVAVLSQDGTFTQGVAALDLVGEWLHDSLHLLPRARATC
jgi:hypothetical protein